MCRAYTENRDMLHLNLMPRREPSRWMESSLPSPLVDPTGGCRLVHKKGRADGKPAWKHGPEWKAGKFSVPSRGQFTIPVFWQIGEISVLRCINRERKKKYHEAYKRDCNAQEKEAKILRERAYFKRDFLQKI